MSIIQERFTLPSHCLFYREQFNPKITLRSMTTEEEMMRLSPCENKFERIAEIIDACILETLPISSYDMCLGDFQFLMTKLWVVSYGRKYDLVVQCPNCNQIVQAPADLDTLDVLELEKVEDLNLEIELPVSKKKVTLAIQTPRMLDDIQSKSNERRLKTKKNLGFEIMFTAMSLIQEIDGKPVNALTLEGDVKKLPAKDINYIIKMGSELNGKVGLGMSVIAQCSSCKYELVSNFRFEPEFLGPQFCED